MIIEIPDDNSIIKWKCKDTDDWTIAEVSDLIKVYARPKGEWIALKLPITEEEGDIKIICSNCKDEFIGQNDLKTWIKVYHFCPSCGADMRMRGGAE